MQFVAGAYMIAVALNLLNVHPIFRYVIIQPPHFLRRFVNSQTTRKDLFAPAVFGFLTIFIPCGTTLAMEALAISSGSPFWGAAILATFVLATMPYFFGLGWVTTKLGDVFQQRFLKFAAVVLIYLGVISINGGLNLIGSPLTFQTVWQGVVSGNGQQNTNMSVVPVSGVQTATINVFANGYNPTYLQLKSGVPVKLNLVTPGGLSCTSIFRIPQLGIQVSLQPTSNQLLQFTPTQRGRITYTCGMGMYSGIMDVI
jgi:hypothetical protein